MLLGGVLPGGGADQAGLKAGDRLLMIDAVRLDEAGGREALLDHMQTVRPDQEVALRVLREGKTEPVTVVAQPRSRQFLSTLDGLDLDFDVDLDVAGIEAMGHPVEAAKAPRLVDLDADLGAYFGVDQGALVLRAPEDGELKSGDVLLVVDGEPVTSARQVHRAIAAAEEPVAAEVIREKRRLSVFVAPGAFPHHWGQRIRIIKLDEGESP